MAKENQQRFSDNEGDIIRNEDGEIVSIVKENEDGEKIESESNPEKKSSKG